MCTFLYSRKYLYTSFNIKWISVQTLVSWHSDSHWEQNIDFLHTCDAWPWHCSSPSSLLLCDDFPRGVFKLPWFLEEPMASTDDISLLEEPLSNSSLSTTDDMRSENLSKYSRSLNGVEQNVFIQRNFLEMMPIIDLLKELMKYVIFSS